MKLFVNIFIALLAAYAVIAGYNIIDAKDTVAPTTVSVTSVYDGDTFTIDSRVWSPFPNLTWKIRVRGIDTPEMKGKCQSEKRLAVKAKEEAARLLTEVSHNTVRLENVSHDKYGGRFVADVYLLDGSLLSDKLISKNLAKRYDGGKKTTWC